MTKSTVLKILNKDNSIIYFSRGCPFYFYRHTLHRFSKLKKMLTPKEVALNIGVSYWTVLRMIKKGELRALRTPGGHYRIPIYALEEQFTHLQHSRAYRERSSVEENIQAFRKYFTQDLAKILEIMQSYQGLLTISDLARILGLQVSSVWYKIKRLRAGGFAFGADIDHYKLGLIKLLVFLDRIISINDIPSAFLRYYAPIVPKGLFLIYYLPLNYDIDDILKLLPKTFLEQYWVIEETYYSRPKYTLYYDFNKRTIVFNWLLMEKRYREKLGKVIFSKPEAPTRIDLIDLLIAKELEKNPFISLRDIQVKIKMHGINLKYSRILRHFKNHLLGRGVIRGIRLRLVPLPSEYNTLFIAKLRGDQKSLHALASTLLEHPSFTATYVAFKKNHVFIMGVVPFSEIVTLSAFMESIKGIDEAEITLLDRNKRKAFTIPYTREFYHGKWILKFK
ncbi:MAG: hypothetical protein DRJ41_04565 [Thermoprotei archaeon]|nr:MAG: hypothetical protein DRJ41_04565 [Thermoprotei archaeon]